MNVSKKIIIIITVATALGLAACAGKAPEATAVKAVAPRAGRISLHVEFSGVLVPNRTVSIYPKLAGQARSVGADVGDRVREGQVLVQIDAKELVAQLQVAEATGATVRDQAAQAKIGIETARLNLDMAQKNYDRTKALFDTKAVTQSQMDDAQTKLDLARTAFDNANRQYQTIGGSGLAQAEAQANLIRVQISNSVITSPIAGTVTNRNINPGELTSTSSSLMTIADTANLKLQGNVPQEEVVLLATGRKVGVRVDGLPGPAYQGVITQVGPVAAATGQYFPVAIAVKNDGRLLAGMTATATFDAAATEGLVVPRESVQRDQGGNYVFVVEGGIAKRRAVVIGPSDGNDVQLISGLAANERVASYNVASLQDGMRVAE